MSTKQCGGISEGVNFDSINILFVELTDLTQQVS